MISPLRTYGTGLMDRWTWVMLLWTVSLGRSRRDLQKLEETSCVPQTEKKASEALVNTFFFLQGSPPPS